MSVPKRRRFTLSDVAKGLRSLTFAESSPGDSADHCRGYPGCVAAAPRVLRSCHPESPRPETSGLAG